MCSANANLEQGNIIFELCADADAGTQCKKISQSGFTAPVRGVPPGVVRSCDLVPDQILERLVRPFTLQDF